MPLYRMVRQRAIESFQRKTILGSLLCKEIEERTEQSTVKKLRSEVKQFPVQSIFLHAFGKIKLHILIITT